VHSTPEKLDKLGGHIVEFAELCELLYGSGVCLGGLILAFAYAHDLSVTLALQPFTSAVPRFTRATPAAALNDVPGHPNE
jgi:hypothetical protein